MTSYCRQWIQHYAEIEAPLAAIVYGKGLTANNRVTLDELKLRKHLLI